MYSFFLLFHTIDTRQKGTMGLRHQLSPILDDTVSEEVFLHLHAHTNCLRHRAQQYPMHCRRKTIDYCIKITLFICHCCWQQCCCSNELISIVISVLYQSCYYYYYFIVCNRHTNTTSNTGKICLLLFLRHTPSCLCTTFITFNKLLFQIFNNE